MTQPTGINTPLGFRNAVVYNLNDDGYPDAQSASTPYEGVRLSGTKTFEVTHPDTREVPHPGDDGIIAVDVLPPNQIWTAQMHTAKENDIVDAAITGQKVFKDGDMTMFGVMTEKDGFNPQVGALLFRQAEVTDPEDPLYGKRTWISRWLPRTYMYPKEATWNDQAFDKIYRIVPAKVGQHLWGVPFTIETEGFLQAAVIRASSWTMPWLAAWKADGVAATFTFSAGKQAASTESIRVYIDGAAVTTNITLAKTGVTFAEGHLPASGKIVVVRYGTNQ